MRDIYRVLEERRADLDRARHDVQALLLALALLREEGDPEPAKQETVNQWP